MPRGGLRRGAGRPKGTGKFGEVTKAVRVPVSMVDHVLKFVEQRGLCYPLCSDTELEERITVSEEERFNLGEFLVQNPASTFLVRVSGRSMIGAGIFPDDILIVDRSIRASNGDVVIACIDGEFSVKRLFITAGRVELRPESTEKKFKPISFRDESELKIWGIVKNVIHRV